MRSTRSGSRGRASLPASQGQGSQGRASPVYHEQLTDLAPSQPRSQRTRSKSPCQGKTSPVAAEQNETRASPVDYAPPPPVTPEAEVSISNQGDAEADSSQLEAASAGTKENR